MVSIGLALRHAQHQLGEAPAAETLEDAAEELARAIEDLRRLAHGIRPAGLDCGLAGALRELAARAPLAMQVRASAERYPNDLEAAAYFIASEAVTNVLKHAHANQIVVHAGRENGNLVLRVSDDGVGGASVAGGSGLRGLSDRVAAHGGRLRIESAAGQGTTLTAEFPCKS